MPQGKRGVQGEHSIASLPLWAQEQIRQQREKIRQLTYERSIMPRTSIEWHTIGDPVYLPDNAVIRFYHNQARKEAYIELKLDGPTLDVNCSPLFLRVLPRASNHVVLTADNYA